MIAIVDTGCANLASVVNACERLGHAPKITQQLSVLQKADKVILPGVGSAPAAMKRLQALNLVEGIKALTQPVLGICLGMQLLFEQSEEGDVDCLGVVTGKIERLKPLGSLPVPHMGWNQIQFSNQSEPSRLLAGIDGGSYVYFVHSFAAPLITETRAHFAYGGNFSAMVEKNNFYGVQYHPERSGTVGARILENFLYL